MPYVLLDSPLLSAVSNPSNRVENVQCRSWVKRLINNDIAIVVPAVIDYELRRTLIQGGQKAGLTNLDRLQDMGLQYLEMSQEMWEKAAQLWAWARNTRQSTAHEHKIDIDCLLGAQAVMLAQLTGEHTVVATKNVKDIARYTPAKTQPEITLEYFQKTPLAGTIQISRTRS